MNEKKRNKYIKSAKKEEKSKMWKIAILICMVNAAVIEGNSLYRKGKYGF